MPTTLRTVNTALKQEGISAMLRKGPGYFYFEGTNVGTYRSSSVMVYAVCELTVQQWIEEYRELEKENL